MARIDDLIKAIKDGQTIDDIQGLITQLNETEGINAKDEAGDTALHWAAADGRQDIVGLLLEKGANINLRHSFVGYTALHFAAWRGHTAVVKLLLQNGADINAQGEDNTTALIWAAYYGHRDVVKLLLQNGADITKAIDLHHLLQQICGEGKPIAEQTASGGKHGPALVGEASADTAEDALNP